jgi:cytochrome P450
MAYWRAAMKMGVAISCMHNFGVPEGDMHQFVAAEDHGALVAKYRLAWAKLMLTPAANSNHVRWKRMQLIAEHWHYTGLSAEHCEQAIAADEEWLKVHPVRGSKRTPSNSGQQQ